MKLRPALLALALAGAAGALCQWLRTPLPWLLGPLIAVAGARLKGYNIQAPPYSRETGQWLIGITLGLYFSPGVAAELVHFAPVILIGAVFALLLGMGTSLLLRQLTGVDDATALFSSMPGGASEMAVLGARNGGRMDLIAAAHSLRITLVVLSVPTLITALDAHGVMPYVPTRLHIHIWGLLLLLLVTALGGWLLQKWRWPNAWMLGALAVTAALTVSDTVWSGMPKGFSQFGQLLLGIALGSRFKPDFLQRAPRFIGSVVLCIGLSLLLCAGFAWVMAAFFALHPASLMLAASPGGIAEMCITAQALGLGVPFITAYHVVRLVVVLTCTEPLWRLLKCLKNR